MHAQQSRADKALELAGEIITIRHERHASQGEKNANADFFSRYTFEAINTFNEWERLEHLRNVGNTADDDGDGRTGRTTGRWKQQRNQRGQCSCWQQHSLQNNHELKKLPPLLRLGRQSSSRTEHPQRSRVRLVV